MLFLLVLAALLLPFALAQDGAEASITVFSTTLITITSCHPTVTDCPGRSQPLPSSSIVSLPPAPPSSSQSSSNIPSCPSSRCNADNCLRAFERGQGQQFCSTFTQSVVTDTAGLPSYTTMCSGSTISRVSSACSCLNNVCAETPPTASQSRAPGCNADNCLRAFERSQGQSFCSTFTQSIVTSTDGLPMYATQCTGSAIARVSSACSCLNSNTPASSSASSTPCSESTQPSQATSSSSVASVESQTATASVSTASSAAPTSQAFSSTVVGTAIQATLTSPSAAPSSQSIQSSAPASAQPTSQSLEVFSFTTTGTDAQGSSFSSVIVATLTPSQVASAQPTSQSLEVFSFTTTGTDAQGSTFSSIIVATLTPSQTASQPAQSSAEVFSFTTTGTDAQGSPFSSVVVATIAPSSSGASSAGPSLQPFSFTSTGTDAQGSSFTTVIQGTFTPSGVALPLTSTEVGTNSQGSTVTSLFTGFGFPFTSTIVGTDSNGNPFTSLFTGVAPAPGSSFTGFSLPTGVSPTPGFSLTLPPQPTAAPTGLCSQFPFCLYPLATDIPKTCSPFPLCLTDAIPSSVQNELSSNCGTTSLLDCILGEPDAPCAQWPQCLSTAVGTDICNGFPFPDCLFTLYSPIVTSTINTDPPNLTWLTIDLPELKTNSLTQTKNSDGIVVWWPVFSNFGCPECGGLDRILGNLPSDLGDFFNIDFTLPGLPEFPEFHFPVGEDCSFF